MSFPLRIGDRLIPDPPSLARAVREDAGAGGGRVLPNQRPRDWVPELVAAKLIPGSLAVALVAALLQDPSPATLVECTYLARALDGRDLGVLLAKAVEAHDVGVLLVAAPGEDGRSVEDMLLLAAANLADVSDMAVRGPLLERLRNAGLTSAELAVLSRGGSAEEIRTWLPSILLEEVEDGSTVIGLLQRTPTRDATISALQSLELPARLAVWAAMKKADPKAATPQLQIQLFPLSERSLSPGA